MIHQMLINLPAFDTHCIEKELEYLSLAGIDLHAIFIHVRDLMVQVRGAPLPGIPTEMIRETFTTSKVIIPNIEFHYWNASSPDIGCTPQQYKEKLLESVIHHARLLYVDLWSLVHQNGIPLLKIINIDRHPHGVFLHVSAA